MKDVSLPVCHKSSVLLCDRLADRASSVSSGTHRLLLQSHVSLRCSSHFLKQREGEEEPLVSVSWSRHTQVLLGCLCLWRFMACVEQKVHNQLSWHGRITTTTTTKNVTLDGSTQQRLRSCPKPLYKDIERSTRTVLELRKRAGPPDFHLTL